MEHHIKSKEWLNLWLCFSVNTIFYFREPFFPKKFHMENSTSYGLTSPGWSNPFKLQWIFLFYDNYIIILLLCYIKFCCVSVVVFSNLVGIVANNGFLSSQASLKVKIICFFQFLIPVNF